MVARALSIAAVLALLAGCGSGFSHRAKGALGTVMAADRRALPGVNAADSATLTDGNAGFAGRLLATLARTHPTLVLSPFSISEALSMTSAGARGSTAEQIDRALGFRLPLPRLAAAFNAQTQSLALADTSGAKLELANALFGQAGQRFRAPFLSILARDYGAGIHIADFSSPAAVSEINRWVSDHTAGKIARLLSPGAVGSTTRLVLVDAVYLDAKWLIPFERSDTYPAAFHAPAGTIRVPTMHQNGTFGYLRGDGYQALELPYKGGRLALDILLADPGQLQQTLGRIASGGPLKALAGMKPQYVMVALPKFQLLTQLELSGPLAGMGMPLAFEPGRADLSGIAGNPGSLYVQRVIHEAYIDVDEAGTQAAAATGVGIGASAIEQQPRLRFVADRPFVFALRDTRTDAILFTGVIARP